MLSSSYDRAKHIVEVDDRILAVFIVDPTNRVSDLFIAHKANIDESFVEKVRDSLNIKFEGQQPSNHGLLYTIHQESQERSLMQLMRGRRRRKSNQRRG